MSCTTIWHIKTAKLPPIMFFASASFVDNWPRFFLLDSTQAVALACTPVMSPEINLFRLAIIIPPAMYVGAGPSVDSIKQLPALLMNYR